MARALHDPKHGYYNSRKQKIGRQGDFTTAPEISENLAKAIAAWLTASAKKLKIYSFIEIGPGLGTLTSQVRGNLPLLLRLRSQFHLVDSSPTLTHLQNQNLGSNATYHPHPGAALRKCKGCALIYSNELVDAFPVRIFEKSSDAWLEVMWNAARNQESLSKPSELPRSSALSLPFPNGQRIEVHESYQTWLSSWVPQWKSGEMLTIDYGDTAETLYNRRPAGSVRAYSHQMLRTGLEVYQNPGQQDITADVNFTDLIDSTQPNLTFLELLNLFDFLKPYSTSQDQRLLTAAAHFQVLKQKPYCPPT